MTNQRYRNTYIDGCSHFCTVSIVERLPIISNDTVRKIILILWSRCRKRYNVRIEGFVIMPEHVHILLSGSGVDVRKFMQYSLSQSSLDISILLEKSSSPKAAQYLDVFRSRGNGKASHKVWKERFRSIALEREDAVLVKLNYMHNNPVKRELVDSPEKWQWSSYASYQGLEGVLSVDTFSCGN